jgi:hypothetical protein
MSFSIAYNVQGLGAVAASVIRQPGTAPDLEIEDEGKIILLDVVRPMTKVDQRIERSVYILQPAIAPNPMLCVVDASVCNQIKFVSIRKHDLSG